MRGAGRRCTRLNGRLVADTSGNREQRRSNKRVQDQQQRAMEKSMKSRRTPVAARRGCLGCLSVVAIIILLVVSIAMLVDTNRNKDKKQSVDKKPTAGQTDPGKVPTPAKTSGPAKSEAPTEAE